MGELSTNGFLNAKRPFQFSGDWNNTMSPGIQGGLARSQTNGDLYFCAALPDVSGSNYIMYNVGSDFSRWPEGSYFGPPPLDHSNAAAGSTSAYRVPWMYPDRHGTIHMFYMSSMDLGKWDYCSFDTNNNTWGTAEEIFDDLGLFNSTNQHGLSCSMDQNEDLHVIFWGLTKFMGVNYDTVYYSNNIGGSFKTAIQLRGAALEVYAVPIGIYMSPDTHVPVCVYMDLAADTAGSPNVYRAYGNALNATSFTIESHSTTVAQGGVGSIPTSYDLFYHVHTNKVWIALSANGNHFENWDARENYDNLDLQIRGYPWIGNPNPRGVLRYLTFINMGQEIGFAQTEVITAGDVDETYFLFQTLKEKEGDIDSHGETILGKSQFFDQFAGTHPLIRTEQGNEWNTVTKYSNRADLIFLEAETFHDFISGYYFSLPLRRVV